MPVTAAISALEARLKPVLDRFAHVAVAVSGGIDSMILAYWANRFSTAGVVAVHAVSPAVPAAATERVRRHAEAHGWVLRLIDAGEMNDPAYRANPVDRCFYCKSNLYGRIGMALGGTILSGANMDDLGDYRPGLKAADLHHVVHPYIEAGVTKDGIYALARHYGLADLAILPPQPCLASRIETGIAVHARDLAFIERCEGAVATRFPDLGTIRCRVTGLGVVLECSAPPGDPIRSAVETQMHALCATEARHFTEIRPYRRGSAFVGHA